MKKLLEYKTYTYTFEKMQEFIQEHDFRVYLKNERNVYAASPRGSIIAIYEYHDEIAWRYIREEGAKSLTVRLGNKVVRVDKIIATLFCKNDVTGYAEIHHLDGDQTNCDASNLTWRSRKARVVEQHGDDKLRRIKKGIKRLAQYPDDYEDLSDVCIMKLED